MCLKYFYKSRGCPKFCKKKIQKLGLFDFTFFGARCPHFCIWFLRNSGLFKYKSQGENDALFLLTRFIMDIPTFVSGSWFASPKLGLLIILLFPERVVKIIFSESVFQNIVFKHPLSDIILIRKSSFLCLHFFRQNFFNHWQFRTPEKLYFQARVRHWIF